MDWTTLIFELFGGLGMFLFGMKMMSDGMQAAAGARIKRIFDILTTNRVMGVMVGLVVTAIIQSSSATTVMVVGFVNAGLMELSQAAGVIMGANIGTTITGWIIVIKVTKYALPILAVGVALLMFSRREHMKNLGTILLGFGLLFFGLKIMEGAFHPFREHTEFISFFAQFGAGNIWQILKSVAAGCLLTMIIQSSSATMGITIALANQGLLTYPAAAALVLGENIGTTITAILASIGANVTAKRAARFHMLFNVIGVCYMVALFPVFVHVVDRLIPGAMDAVLADGTKPYIAAHIAAGHSLFNIFNTLLFLPFAGVLVKLATLLVPGSKEKEEKKLEYIDYNFIHTPSIALGQAKKETVKMSSMALEMYRWMGAFMKNPSADSKQLERLFKYENITDALQHEITQFLAHILRDAPAASDAEEARRFIRVVDELESIGDQVETITKILIRREESNAPFTDESWADLEKVHAEIYEYLEFSTHSFIGGRQRFEHEANTKNAAIRAMLKKKRGKNEERMKQGSCDVSAGMLFNDILTSYRRITAHAHNITETMAGQK